MFIITLGQKSFSAESDRKTILRVHADKFQCKHVVLLGLGGGGCDKDISVEDIQRLGRQVAKLATELHASKVGIVLGNNCRVLSSKTDVLLHAISEGEYSDVRYRKKDDLSSAPLRISDVTCLRTISTHVSPAEAKNDLAAVASVAAGVKLARDLVGMLLVLNTFHIAHVRLTDRLTNFYL